MHRILLCLLIAGVMAMQPAPTFAQAPAATATATAPLPSITLPPALDRVLRDYERAWRARNADSLAALFTQDGFTLSSSQPMRRGRAAIRDGYANSGGPLALRAVAYAADDTVGYIIGAYARESGDPDIGKFVLALRRASGGPWRIAADMDNGNGPPRR
jgi:ketosteroid isomerase-like protein